MWFDTHAHLADPQLAEQIESVVDRAIENGVLNQVCIGTDLRSSYQAVALANRFESVYAAVGIHPNQCQLASPAHFKELATLAVKETKVVALGETGLDRYWDDAPFDLQKQFFRWHLEHSLETNIPLVIHMRDCDQDILDSLLEFAGRSFTGIMHSFSGSWELAKKFLKLGLHISFSGMVTFKKNDELRQVAARIPDDRLLIETDSPYLSPHPHRSQRPNEPGLVIHTGNCLAEVRNVQPEELAGLTTENAKRLFGILA